MDGFFKWYRSRSSKLDLSRQIEFFDRHSVVIEHPIVKKCILLNVDGEQVFVAVEDIYRLMEMRLGAFDLEWWLSSDVDLTCEIASIPAGGEVQTYYLSGLTIAQRNTIGSMLVEYAKLCSRDTVGYVLDRNGRTEDFDWDGPILYGRQNVATLPDIFALHSDVARKIGQFYDETTTLNVGDNLIEIAFEGNRN